MSELVSRLRSHANWYISCAGGNIPDEAATEIEAADAITRLQKELETAREDALEEAAKVAETPRRQFVSGPEVRQYVTFAATETAAAIRALQKKEATG